MADRWAITGVDLHLKPLGSRVRAGLEDALRDAVRDGRLAAGTRLPSTRALAADLGLARNTVAEAYSQLVAEGWLEARQGSGTRVAERPRAGRTRAAVRAVDDAGNGRVAAARHNLRPGSPDLTSFPRAAWISATRRALAAAPPDAFGYEFSQGRPELRSALAEYLARARGVIADPERIVVCGGFAEALSLACEVLAARGARRLATERHGLDTHRHIAARHGLATQPLEIDEHGARTDQLAGGDADAVLLTPAHQFPFGVALAPARRSAAVHWASDGGRTVIEDDYDGEFRYDRQPVGAMQALAPERVVYAGTASKSLAPGLRIAWLVLPDELHRHAVEIQDLLRSGPDAVAQLALAELIGSGAYDRHVRRARLVYRRRRDRLLTTVARAAPAVRVHGIAAGLHALLELPPGSSEEEVIGHAASRGLALSGLESFTDGPADGGPALVIGYATPPEHGYTAALARLAAVLAETC
jgi:GntR family transcriptional regulator / MocR family aminotransferase